MKDRVIANRPRNTAEQRYGKRNSGESNPRMTPSARSPSQPHEQQRKKRREHRIGHQRKAPQQPIAEPVARPAGFGKHQSGPENDRDEQRGETRFPHAFIGEQNRIRENGPEPCGSGAESYTGNALAHKKNRNACEAYEQNVDCGGRQKRMERVNPKNLENSRKN